jgi:hypothetical protein
VEYLALNPGLSEHVVDLAAVEEGHKRWLLAHAAAMLYPSVHEGFGLVPFEAAEAGLLCAFASQTAVGELLPESLALIEQWNPRLTAERIVPYLRSPELAEQHVAGVRAAAARLTWHKTARALADVYEVAAGARSRESRRLADQILDVERKRREDQAELEAEQARFAELERGYRTLRESFDETAEGLLGPNGVIPPDLRRPLLAIGTRRSLRVPIFGLVRVFYGTGYRLRHLGRGPNRER